VIAPDQRSLSLRISVTDKCQLRCIYCMPADGVPLRAYGQILRFEEIVRFVRAMKGAFRPVKVRLTGGEPLIRRDFAVLVGMLADEGVADLAMTTNGQALAAAAVALKRAGLRRVNVSLDSLDPRTYARVTRGGRLSRTLAGIDAALAAGLTPVKLNTAVLRGVNSGELIELVRFGIGRGCQVRFLEVMPIGPAARQAEAFVSSAEVLEMLKGAYSLRAAPAPAGSSSRNFIATARDGAEGIVGVISPCSEPFCDGCDRLRLTAAGELIGCLALGEGADIRPLLRGGGGEADLQAAARAALGRKRTGREFATTRHMSGTGG